MCGLRPVAEIMYIDFITLGMDQLVNIVAKNRYMFGGKTTVPMVIRTQGGAGRGIAAHHSQSLETWFVHLPGVLIATPATPYDAKGLLKTAIRDDNPVLFIEHKMLYRTTGEVPEGDYALPLGQAKVTRPGSDVTVVSYSRMANRSLEAAEVVAAEGIDAEVIDLRSLRPLDMESVLESVKKTGHLVLVSEGYKNANALCEVAFRVNEFGFDYLDGPMLRVCAADVPVPMSPVLEEAAVPSVESIAGGIRQALAD